MAEITRQDLISDDALNAPGRLADELEKVSDALDEIIAKGKENKTASDEAQSIKELTKKVAELESEQKKLVDSNKKLQDAQKKTAASSESQADALDAVDDRMGGVIGRTKELGKQLWALVKNPIILTLAAIVAALAACAAAAKVFFTTTGEGEDALDRQMSSWNQFFNVLKSNFASLGKSISGWFEDMGGSSVFIHGTINALKVMFPFMSGWLNKVQADFINTEDDAQRLTATLDALEDRMIENIIRRAKTNKDANNLMLASEDKLKYSTQQRIQLLERGIKVKQDQLKEDIAIASIAAKALLIETGLEHGLSEEQALRMSQAERYAKFTAEENTKIAQAMADIINLEARYATEVRRNTVKVIALKEQLRQEIVKKAQDAAAKEIQEANNTVAAQIAFIQNRAVAGAISVAEAERQITQVRKDRAAELVNAQIEGMRKVLLVEELTAEERAAIEQQLFTLKNDLVKAYYDGIVEQSKLSFEHIAEIYMEFSSALGNLSASLHEQRMQEIDAEEKRMEEYYETRIRMAGDNEARVSELENESDRKRQALENRRIAAQRRAAIFDKAVSATQAGVATALAIIRMLANPGGPAGVALSIAAGITGALQVAAILAKPIPQYADGGFTTAALILAGEQGTEKFKTPGGRVGYTPDRPTLMRLPIGTEITPHDKTMQELAADGIERLGNTRGTAADVTWALINKLDSVEQAILNKRETHYNWTRRGLEKAFKNGESRTYFMNEFYK